MQLALQKGEKGEKGAEKRGGCQQRGQKEKRTRENRSGVPYLARDVGVHTLKLRLGMQTGQSPQPETPRLELLWVHFRSVSGPFRVRLGPFGSVWVCFGSVSGPFRVRFGVLGGVGGRGCSKGKEYH